MAKVRIKPIKPKHGFGADEFKRAFDRTLSDVGDEVQADYERTTATWETEVDFVKRVGDDYVTVYARGAGRRIYGYVDEGTKPHDIAPKAKSALAFPANYAAKTKPGVIGSTSGGGSGPTIVRRKTVHHPGTAERGFSKAIKTKWSREFPARFRRTIREVLR